MVMYVLGVRCLVYVKGLGETYMTLDRRVLLLLLLYLLLLSFEKKKKWTAKSGRFQKDLDLFAEKISRENPSLLKVHTACRITRTLTL